MNERASVFIDGSNLEMAVRESFGQRVIPELLVNKLTPGLRLIGVYYYEAPLLQHVNPESFQTQQAFFERLRRNPYFELRFGSRVERHIKRRCPQCGKEINVRSWIQKGIDALMVLDLICLATEDAYDIAIVVSGDKDLKDAFLRVKALGKIVWNAFTEHGWASAIKEVADKAIVLDQDLLDGCWEEKIGD